MKNMRTITKAKGITVIHPHSGKVSRSVALRCIRNYFKGCIIPDYGTIYLVDVNYSIYAEDYSPTQHE